MNISAPSTGPLSGLEISDDPHRLDLDRICAWLAESYWAHDRDRAAIERSLAHSFSYGAYDPSGLQVALTRATSDLASFCWLGDVVVAAEWRGRGLGSWLVQSVVDHQMSLGVPRFLLATRDAHGVYERLGFTGLQVPAIYMERDERATRPLPGDRIGR